MVINTVLKKPIKKVTIYIKKIVRKLFRKILKVIPKKESKKHRTKKGKTDEINKPKKGSKRFKKKQVLK